MSSVHTIPQNQAEINSTSDNVSQAATEILVWRIHLAAQNPRALPGVLGAILTAALLASLLFHNLIAGAVAALLLIGAIREYLFPVEYQISSAGARCKFAGSIIELPWKDVRRFIVDKRQITVTSLAVPSRLDVFRGVTLKFAPDGCIGSKQQVCLACLHYAPDAIGADLISGISVEETLQ